MFNPRRITEALRKNPFETLELKFTDGTIERIEHPDNAVVFASEIGIAQYEKGEDQIAERLKMYALVHLISVDTIPRQADSRRNQNDN